MLLVLLAAVLTAVGNKYTMSRGVVRITQVELEQDTDGIVNGSVLWLFYDPDRQVHRYIVGSFKNMKRPDLLELKPDAKYQFEYRSWSLGPIKRQPPNSVFLYKHLEIPKRQIIGALSYELLDEVVIDGSK